MLRHILGDEEYFSFLLDYRETYEYGNVLTEDLIVVAESHYRNELDWFFDPWLYHAGRPTYEYSWTSHGTGPYTVNLVVSQVQSAEYPAYTMPIDVVLETTGAGIEFVIWDSLRTQAFQFVTANEPTGVTLDPDSWILADFTGVPAEAPAEQPQTTFLAATTPNPFGESATIRFGLSRPGTVALRVFDVDGRMVRTLLRGHHAAGEHQVAWKGRGDSGQPLPNGLYFLRLVGPDGVQERRTLLLR